MSATLTLKSAIQTASLAGTGPGTASVTGSWQLPGLIDGRVKVLLDTYTGLGTGEDAGSVVTFAALPTGANILAIYIGASAATSSLTISLGDSNSAARYLAGGATQLQAAGMYLLPGLGIVPGYVVGTNYVSATSQDSNIIMTTAGAALGTGTIYRLMVFYSLD